MKIYSVRVTPEVAKTRPQSGGRRNVALVVTFDVHPVVWLGPLPTALAQDTGLYIEELSGHAAAAALERPVSGIGVDVRPLPEPKKAHAARKAVHAEAQPSDSIDRAALEQEYLLLTGQKPNRLLRLETLRQKVDEAKAEAEAQGTQGTD